MKILETSMIIYEFFLKSQQNIMYIPEKRCAKQRSNPRTYESLSFIVLIWFINPVCVCVCVCVCAISIGIENCHGDFCKFNGESTSDIYNSHTAERW